MEADIITGRTFGKNEADALFQEGTVFDKCVFGGGTFTALLLHGIILLDCRFTGCDFSLSAFANTAMDGVTFSGCKMSGTSFGERNSTHRLSASFTECIFDNAVFLHITADAVFRQCRMHDTVFESCNLKGVLFDACDMQGSSFTDNDLRNADFLTSFGFTIDPETNRLNGARFSQSSLPGLLAKYRIKIENP